MNLPTKTSFSPNSPCAEIDVAAYGPPRSPRTWSGTPYHLTAAIEKIIPIRHAHDALEPKYLKLFSYGMAMLLHRTRSELHRVALTRFARRWFLRLKLGIDPKVPTLHYGTLFVPVPAARGSSHYVFTDATWHTWADGRKIPEPLWLHIEAQEKIALQSARHVFTVSQHAAESVSKHYDVDPRRVTPVGTGRGGIRPFFGEKPSGPLRILFVAKERFADKGGELLVDAFRLARAETDNIELTIVGQDSYLERGDMEGITVKGFVALEELQALFESSHLFVLPAYHEPWGLVYLEALSCKTAIVGLRRHAFPEISGNGKFGFIAEEATPEALGAILVRAARDRNSVITAGELGQKHVLENFDWDICARTITDIIQADLSFPEKHLAS